MSLINITKFHTWRGVSMHFITAVSVFTLIDAYLSVYLLQAGSHYVAWAAWHWNAGSVKQSCLFISGEFWILTELFSLFIFKRGGGCALNYQWSSNVSLMGAGITAWATTPAPVHFFMFQVWAHVTQKKSKSKYARDRAGQPREMGFTCLEIPRK